MARITERPAWLAPSASTRSRLGWFVVIWVTSVAALAVVAWVCRWLLLP
jgi:hypothetical protein